MEHLNSQNLNFIVILHYIYYILEMLLLELSQGKKNKAYIESLKKLPNFKVQCLFTLRIMIIRFLVKTSRNSQSSYSLPAAHLHFTLCHRHIQKWTFKWQINSSLVHSKKNEDHTRYHTHKKSCIQNQKTGSLKEEWRSYSVPYT